MNRTTVFLSDDLERLLRETARHAQRPQAEIGRDALTEYLRARRRPWLRAVGLGASSDALVDSENVKDWIHDSWREESESS